MSIWQQSTRLQKTAIGAGLAFLPYELYMRWWETTAAAPIRIDLILIYPALAILMLAALGQWVWQRLNK